MKDEHKVTFIAIGYGFVLTLVTLIIYENYVIWSILGALTSLFNHSQMLNLTKNNKISSYKLAIHLVTRFTMYIIMMAIVYFRLRNNQEEMITALIILLLGFSSIKIGVIIYSLPIFKKSR